MDPCLTHLYDVSNGNYFYGVINEKLHFGKRWGLEEVS